MPGEILEFPGREPPPGGYSEEHVDKLHAEAFRDLEGRIDDCAIMASIALQMVEPAIGGREDKHEKAMFAVFEVAKMLKKLKTDYQAMWHCEKRGAL
jgi:hypothetical protein